MTLSDVSSNRLNNQHIVNPSNLSVQKLVHRMGALQAQSYKWVKWAVGIRLPGSTLDTVEKAIAEGDIIRTHLLRPTWHVVSADDLRWMLKLTAPRVKIAMRSRHKQLELTDEVIAETNKIIEKELKENDYLTRKELVRRFEEAGFKNENNLASHILLRAELDGVMCSGPTEGKHHTYALFEKRVPQTRPLTKEESLQRLTTLYFTSHGPATLDDFVWWSGLTKTAARKAIEMIEPGFEKEEIDEKIVWFKPDHHISSPAQAYLLPAYDEFIVGYTDRSAVLSDDNHKKVISMNGIFKPVIVIDGKVAGIWKRKISERSLKVEAEFFNSTDKKSNRLTEQAAECFAKFLDKELQLTL